MVSCLQYKLKHHIGFMRNVECTHNFSARDSVVQFEKPAVKHNVTATEMTIVSHGFVATIRPKFPNSLSNECWIVSLQVDKEHRKLFFSFCSAMISQKLVIN